MSLIKLKNNALDNLTSFEGSASLGDMVFISSATASSSASIEFDLGSYKEYKFFFVNCHPATNGANLSFQCSTDGGSTYGMTITNTYFRAFNYESDSGGLGYVSAFDYAQSTSNIMIHENTGNDNDQSISGYMHLFNPSSSTFVKHFITRTNSYNGSDISTDAYTAGYINDTNDVDAIKFLFSSGNIDDGKMLLFGLN